MIGSDLTADHISYTNLTGSIKMHSIFVACKFRSMRKKDILPT